MLSFPAEFYQAETRNDFYVDSTMKTVWAAELEVLAAVAAVCEKYQLPWFADWGTLLGAVRHNGYIPWDDDIDICMLRPDYEKLMDVLQKELPEGWFVYHTKSGNRQEEFWACVMNSDNISLDKERLTTFHGCPFIVGIDIFPLDYLPKNPILAKQEEEIFELIWQTIRLVCKESKSRRDEKDLAEALKSIEHVMNIKISRQEDLRSQLWKAANDLCRIYGEEESDLVACCGFYFDNKKRCFDKMWYNDVVYMPFEIVELPVPIGYDSILRNQYGDYMIPVKNYQSHEYPFYNKQLEQLRAIIKEMEEKTRQGGV